MALRMQHSMMAVGLAALVLGACSKEEAPPVAQVETPAPAAPAAPPPTDAERLANAVVDLGGTQTSDAVKITLSGDRFAAGKSAFEPGDKIDAIAKLLSEHPSARVMVEGYTDSRGGNAVNQRLSAQRADSVKDALVARGVDAGRIETAGRGEAQPVASNDTAEGRAENRRVELTFASGGGDRLAAAAAPDGGG